MIDSEAACPQCGPTPAEKDGHDRGDRRIFRCRSGRCRPTALTATPFSGYRFPRDVIALSGRWYLRYRLSYTDRAELLAERGVCINPSTIYAWVREFSPF